MDRDGVIRFLMALGADYEDIDASGEVWINTYCPLAPWTHSLGMDSHPSAGIAESGDGRSVFYCFGCCNESGKGLASLLHTIYVQSGDYPWEAARVYLEWENHEASSAPIQAEDSWEEYARQSQVQALALPKEDLRKFPKLQGSNDIEADFCYDYLEKRGVGRMSIHMAEVRYNPGSDTLVFPLTDLTGEPKVLRERVVDAKKMWTVSPKRAESNQSRFPTLKTHGVWFNMHNVDFDRPLLLVEGEIDVLRVISLGWSNVIAAATSSVSRAQINALVADTILNGFDDDSAGESASLKVGEAKRRTANVFSVEWSVVSCEDPAALPDSQALRKAMKSLVPIDKKFYFI